MEITLETKIYDLLRAYPFMEDELIRINPKFKKLKNPVLKRTVARIASIKQAAAVGGMDAVELLNAIRTKVGQKPLDVQIEQKEEEAPAWIAKEPKAVLNANRLLDEGKNPLAEISKRLKSLEDDEIIVLESDFKPEPLIEEMKKKGVGVYSKEVEPNRFLTYLCKCSKE